MSYKLRKGQELADRTLAVGVRALGVMRALPRRDPAAKHVGTQLLRAATSIGANYEEARAAESSDDFAHKVSIAAKEARETIYWLRFIEASELISRPVDKLIDELEQLSAILLTSRRTARGA